MHTTVYFNTITQIEWQINSNKDQDLNVTITSELLAECMSNPDSKQKLLEHLKSSNIKGITIIPYNLSAAEENNIPGLIAEIFEACTDLQSIELQNIPINEEQSKILAEKLAKHKNLQEFTLKSCDFYNSQSFVNVISKLDDKTQLRKFEIQKVRLDERHIEAMSKALKDKNNLQEFRAEGCKINDHGLEVIADAMENKPNLIAFSLNENAITERGAKALNKALKNKPNLNILELKSNEVGTEGAKAIAEALKDNKHLTHINLYFNNIKESGMDFIAPVIKNSGQLVYLNLDHNSIGPKGAITLAEAIADKKIQSLSLNGNQIKAQGTKAIANALKNNDNLEQLYLAGNEIQDDGAKAVADAITDKKIQSLSLNDNQITAQGAKAIATALKNNDALKHLYLEGNQIQDEGAKAIADAVTGKQNLGILSLSNNNIKYQGGEAIAKAVATTPNVMFLQLFGNQIGNATEQISKAFQNRRNKISDPDTNVTDQQPSESIPSSPNLNISQENANTLDLFKAASKLVQATHNNKYLYSSHKLIQELELKITGALLASGNEELTKEMAEIGKTPDDKLNDKQKEFLKKASTALAENIVEINHLKNYNVFKYIGQIIWKAFASAFYSKDPLNDHTKGYKEIKDTEVKPNFTEKLIKARQEQQGQQATRS